MSDPDQPSRFAGLRMAFLANLNSYGRSRARLNAFRELGLDVVEIAHTAEGDPTTGIEKTSLFRRAAWKLGMPLDWEGAGSSLLALAPRFKPEIVWVEKGMMLGPRLLDQVKRIWPEAVLAWFSEDDMFARHNRTRRFDAALGRYDVVFTTKSYNTHPKELPALGARRVSFVPQAFDPMQHHPVAVSEADLAASGGDLGFIGSFEPERARSMLRLAEAGLRVRVWGNGWEACRFRHRNLRLEHRPLVNLPPHDLAYTRGIAATRINLCFLRKLNRDLHTSRTFEIPAIGGFMLGERTPEHLAYFKEGVEAEFFGSDDELVDKARYYLEHEQERRAVAARGHARCLAQYGSTRQAEHLLGVVATLLPGRA